MIKIEIWSDINCPFCYIGKRHLEMALASSSMASEVQLEWKSFELDPEANPPKGIDNAELLAKKYGKDRSWALEMNQNLTQMAASAGLHFQMDKVIPANSLNAHRLLHLARKHNSQDAMKEKLLAAKFVEGKDINDKETIVRLGSEVGVPVSEIEELFETDEYVQDVRADEMMAARMGIRGVPFFVFNSQYGLSGAQPVEVFKEVLEKIKSP